jgi:hypothetical protein
MENRFRERTAHRAAKGADPGASGAGLAISGGFAAFTARISPAKIAFLEATQRRTTGNQ